MWYNENRNYNYSLNEFQQNASHFTQIIWRDTKSIGIGFSKSSNGCYLVVNYYPSGNRDSEFTNNVLRRKEEN